MANPQDHSETENLILQFHGWLRKCSVANGTPGIQPFASSEHNGNFPEPLPRRVLAFLFGEDSLAIYRCTAAENEYRYSPVELMVTITPEGAQNTVRRCGYLFVQRKEGKKWELSEFPSAQEKSWCRDCYSIRKGLWNAADSTSLRSAHPDFLPLLLQPLRHELDFDQILLGIPRGVDGESFKKLWQECAFREVRRLKSKTTPVLIQHVRIFTLSRAEAAFSMFNCIVGVPAPGSQFVYRDSIGKVSLVVWKEGRFEPVSEKGKWAPAKTYAVGMVGNSLNKGTHPIEEGYYLFRDESEVQERAEISYVLQSPKFSGVILKRLEMELEMAQKKTARFAAMLHKKIHLRDRLQDVLSSKLPINQNNDIFVEQLDNSKDAGGSYAHRD